MPLNKLLSLSIGGLAQSYRRRRIESAIARTQRDLDLTAREIAEKLDTKRALHFYLMNLKAERNSL